MSASSYLSLVGTVTLLVFSGSATTVRAARLLNATVEVDGRVVLRTAFADDSNPHVERVWRYLGDEPGWTEETSIDADTADPLTATLMGDIVIRVLHVDRTIVEARTDELTLTRASATSDRWHFPETEVERIAAANGIGEPSAFHMSEGERLRTMLTGVGIAGFVIAVGGGWWWLRRGSRKGGNESGQA